MAVLVLVDVQPNGRETCAVEVQVNGKTRREAGTGASYHDATAVALSRLCRKEFGGGISLHVDTVSIDKAEDSPVHTVRLSVHDGTWLAKVVGEDDCPIYAATVALVDAANKRLAYLAAESRTAETADVA